MDKLESSIKSIVIDALNGGAGNTINVYIRIDNINLNKTKKVTLSTGQNIVQNTKGFDLIKHSKENGYMLMPDNNGSTSYFFKHLHNGRFAQLNYIEPAKLWVIKCEGSEYDLKCYKCMEEALGVFGGLV